MNGLSADFVSDWRLRHSVFCRPIQYPLTVACFLCYSIHGDPLCGGWFVDATILPLRGSLFHFFLLPMYYTSTAAVWSAHRFDIYPYLIKLQTTEKDILFCVLCRNSDGFSPWFLEIVQAGFSLLHSFNPCAHSALFSMSRDVEPVGCDNNVFSRYRIRHEHIRNVQAVFRALHAAQFIRMTSFCCPSLQLPDRFLIIQQKEFLLYDRQKGFLNAKMEPLFAVPSLYFSFFARSSAAPITASMS